MAQNGEIKINFDASALTKELKKLFSTLSSYDSGDWSLERNLRTQIEEVEHYAEQLQKALENGLDTHELVKNFKKSLDAFTKNTEGAQANIEKLQDSIVKGNKRASAEDLKNKQKEYDRQLKALERYQKEVNRAMRTKVGEQPYSIYTDESQQELKKYNTIVKDIRTNLKETREEKEKLLSESTTKISSSDSYLKFTNALGKDFTSAGALKKAKMSSTNDVAAFIQQTVSTVPKQADIKAYFSKAGEGYENFLKGFGKLSKEENKAVVAALSSAYSFFEKEMKKITPLEKDLKAIEKAQTKIEPNQDYDKQLRLQRNDLSENVTAARTSYSQAVENDAKIQTESKLVDVTELTALTTKMSDYKKGLLNMADASEQAILRQEALNAQFDNFKAKIGYFLSFSAAFSAVKQTLTQTYEDIKNLDKAFASIAMVTEYSVDEMWDSYDKYAEMANELGQSTQSVIESSALFYQQGWVLLAAG